jgi:hypothetical protein
LPPTCPGFDPAAEMKAAYAAGLNVVVRLEPQYSAYGCTGAGPSLPCNSPEFGCFGGGGAWVLPDPLQEPWQGHLRATADPDSNSTSYKTVALSYARVAASLPKPTDGSVLHVQIGNELNLAWSFPCEAHTLCVPMATVAREAAFFLRDAAAAIADLSGVTVAVAPIAPMGFEASGSCSNASECHKAGGSAAECECAGAHSVTLTSLSFESMMIDAVPNLCVLLPVLPTTRTCWPRTHTPPPPHARTHTYTHMHKHQVHINCMTTGALPMQSLFEISRGSSFMARECATHGHGAHTASPLHPSPSQVRTRRLVLFARVPVRSAGVWARW